MGDIFKLAITLVVISLIAGLAIAFTNGRTIEKILDQERLAEELALKAVFPVGTKIVADSLEGEKFWKGSIDNSEIGYAFLGKSYGFSSDIKFIAGVDFAGKILGLVILSQSETPGLGTRVQEIVSSKFVWNGLFAKSEKGIPWFTEQFKGISVKKDISIDKSTEWHKMSEADRKAGLINNRVTALTGATISTKAVIKGVKKVCGSKLALLNVNKEIEQIMDEVTGPDFVDTVHTSQDEE